jgi:hypothetical protein
MSNRSSWWASVTSTFVGAVLLAGIVVPSALAKPKDKGVPPGVPFQALQRQIDALDARVDALESLAGLMWINTLDVRAGTSTLALDPAGPGLLVTGVADDVLQVGLQVPLGFVIAEVKVCYVAGASGAFINGVSLSQYAVPPTVPPTVLNAPFVPPGPPAAGTLTCIDATPAGPVDPSSGPVYLSLSIDFPAADAIAIRGIGLQLEPAP